MSLEMVRVMDAKERCDWARGSSRVSLKMVRVMDAKDFSHHPYGKGPKEPPLQWLQCVSDKDITWLRHQVRTLLPEGSIDELWDDWWKYLYPSGRRWNKVIRRAMIHSILQERKVAGWYQWHKEVCTILLDHGVFVREVGETKVSQEHFCLACRKVFRTCAAWSVHSFKIHDRRTRVRDVATGTQCQICLKQYKNHASLINHLKYSQACYEQLVLTEQWVDAPQPAMNSRQDRLCWDRLPPPPMQAEGPKQPRVQQQAAVVTEAQRSLLQRWDEIRQDPDYTDSYVEFRSIADRLRRATLTTTLAAMEIRSLMDEWRQQLLQQGRTTELCGFDRGLQHLLNRY